MTRRCVGITNEDRKCKLRISKEKGYFCHIHNPIGKKCDIVFIFQHIGKNLKSYPDTLISSIDREFIMNFLVNLYVILVFFKFFGFF